MKKRFSPAYRKSAFYYASQLVVLATPFLLVPFLARVVGPAGLGLYGIGQSIALIANTAVDYGFQLNGARHVAQNRDNNSVVFRMIEGVLATKCLMSFICLVLGPVLAWLFVPDIAEYRIVVLSIALGVFQGNNFYWYFGGVDRLVLAGTIDLLAKLFSLAGIFLLVRGPSDLWLVFVVQVLAQFIAVAWSLGLVFSYYKSPLWPDWRGGIALLRENFEVTIRSSVSMVYTGTTVLVMGIVSPAGAVGYLSGAERIVRGAILPMAPLRQTFFPSVSASAARDSVAAASSVRRLLFITVAMNFVIMLVFITFAGPIVRVALGEKFLPSVNALRILAAWPLLSGIAEVIGTLWLLPLRFDWESTKIVFLTAPVHVIAVLVLSRLWQESGAALAMEISALFAFFLLISFVARRTPLFRAPTGSGRQ